MKKTTIQHLLIILFCIIAPVGLKAQQIEKTVSGETYIINTTRNVIVNKNDLGGFDKIKGGCDYYSIEEPTSFNDIVKAAFTKEKLEFLAKENRVIAILFCCNSDGFVESAQFLMRKTKYSYLDYDPTSITLKEINDMNQRLKKYKFVLNDPCPNIEYYRISRMIRFSNL